MRLKASLSEDLTARCGRTILLQAGGEDGGGIGAAAEGCSGSRYKNPQRGSRTLADNKKELRKRKKEKMVRLVGCAFLQYLSRRGEGLLGEAQADYVRFGGMNDSKVPSS